MNERASRSGLRIGKASLLLPIAGVLLACGGSSESGGGGAHDPQLANLAVQPTVVAVNEGGGAVSVAFSAYAFDEGSDVDRVVATVLDGVGTRLGEYTTPIENPPGTTLIWCGGSFLVSTTEATTFTLEFQAFDARGSASNVLRATFEVVAGYPVPAIAALAPASIGAGGPVFTLTVTGSGFVPASSVSWGGSILETTYVDPTTLRVEVPPYHTSYARTVQVTVVNPSPGGGTSVPFTFTVAPQAPYPVPTLSALSPTSADAGGPSFDLTVSGSGFVPASQVQWGGYSLATTLVDEGTLRARVTTERLSAVGTVDVRVHNPWPGGGTSGPLPFAVTMPSIPGVTLVSQQASDLVWDPYRRKIYLAVPGASPVHPNAIVELDPFTGQLGPSRFAGSEPAVLALSDDGRFLYVGLKGASSVGRFLVPGFVSDLQIDLGRHASYGPYYARDIQVAPGAPHALAVSLAVSSYGWVNALAVFDDATQRSATVAPSYGSFESIQWGASASTLYAMEQQSARRLIACSVGPAGVSLAADYRETLYSTRIRYDVGTGLLYGDDGRAVDPATGAVRGTFPRSELYTNIMVPDSSLGSAFFVGTTSYYEGALDVRAYDLSEYVETRSMSLQYLKGPASRLVRFGQDGLALLTPTRVVLLRGPLVLPASASANPTPTLSAIAPSSASAGAGNFRMTVTGSGFVSGSVVRWNGSDRSTRFVSATELVAYIPADDVVAAGSSQVVVASPAPGGGTSGTLSFTTSP